MDLVGQGRAGRAWGVGAVEECHPAVSRIRSLTRNVTEIWEDSAVSTSTRDQLAAALEKARREQHVSIRAAARSIGLPTATVQGWLNGHHFPTPALRPQFLQLVQQLGLEAQLTPELWGVDVEGAWLAKDSPYLGLRPYSSDDWTLFSGRDAESARLATEVLRLSGEPRRVLVVLGASGSGKSSLVAAGVAGRHTQPGDILSGWNVRFFGITDLGEMTTTEPHELWVMDQFDDQIRSQAIEGLDRLTSLPDGVVVLVVLRADAFGEAARFPELREPLSRPFLVGPVTGDDLRRIVTGPAEAVGTTVDPQLVELVLRDAGQTSDDVQPGVLPLISNALAAGWTRSDGKVLRASDYLAAGGLAHSIDELAESAYAGIEGEAADSVKALFLSLVSLDGEAIVRRHAQLDELSDAHRSVAHVYAAARLLTISDTEVWISHDALIAHWPRLGEWIEEDRSRLRAMERLQQAAGSWEEQGRPDALLLPVNRLPVFQAAVQESGGAPTALVVREFVTASESHFASVVQQERVVNGRLRRRARIVTTLAVLATVLAVIAGYQVVRTQAIQADAQSRQVAAAAVGLRVVDPNVRAQMATAASVISDTREGNSAVLDAAAADTPTRWTGPADAVAGATLDGSYVVRANSVGEVTWWPAGVVRTSPGTTFVADTTAAPIYAVAAVVRAGRLLVATAGKCRTVWDVTAEPKQLYGACPKDTTYAAAFSGDGSLLVFGGEQSATWMTVADQSVVALQEAAAAARAVTFTTSGDVFLGGDGPVTRWSRTGSTYAQLSTMPEAETRSGRVQALAVSPDGHWLAAGIAASEVRLWDLTSGTELPAVKDVTSYVNGLAFSADNSRLAIADSDQKAYVVSTSDWSVERVLSDPAQVTAVAWTGTELVSSSIDGSLRVWDGRSPIIRRSGTPLWQLTADATGEKWLATASGGKVMLWKGTGLETAPTPTVPSGFRLGSALAINSSGTELVVGTRTGAVASWTLGEAGAGEPRTSQLTDTGSFGSIAISPDGSTMVATRYLGTTAIVAHRGADGAWSPTATLDTPTPQTGAFTADGKEYCVGSADGYVMVFDMTSSTPRLLETLKTDADPTAVTTSRQGTLLAAGTDLGTVYLWDLSDPTKPTVVHTYHDAISPVDGVSFSPDGQHLAAASGEGYLWLWDIGKDTTARYSLTGGLGTALDVRFYANGQKLLGAGDTGQLRAWETTPAAARTQLCAKQGTPLTGDEWARYLPGVARQKVC